MLAIVLGAVFGAGILCILYGIFVERTWFRVSTYRLDILPADSSGPVRVLHLSDLHFTRRDRRKRRFLASLPGADVTVVTGDMLGEAGPLGLAAADVDVPVTHDRIGGDELAPVELAPEGSLARDRDSAVDGAQLEHAVAGSARVGEGRRDGDEATEQGKAEPAHRQRECYLPNYAANERNVRSFLRHRLHRVTL